MISIRADITEKINAINEQKKTNDREWLRNYPLDVASDNPNISSVVNEFLTDTFSKLGYDFNEYPTLEEMPHGNSPGFFNFTDGGWSISNCGFLTDVANDNLRNKKIKSEVTKCIARNYEGALEQFKTERADELKDVKPKNINYQDLYSLGLGGLAEALSEYEAQWNDGEICFYIRVYFYSAVNSHRQFQSSSRPEIRVRAGVEGAVDVIVFEKSIGFSSLTELKTKLKKCSEVIEQRL